MNPGPLAPGLPHSGQQAGLVPWVSHAPGLWPSCQALWSEFGEEEGGLCKKEGLPCQQWGGLKAVPSPSSVLCPEDMVTATQNLSPLHLSLRSLIGNGPQASVSTHSAPSLDNNYAQLGMRGGWELGVGGICRLSVCPGGFLPSTHLPQHQAPGLPRREASIPPLLVSRDQGHTQSRMHVHLLLGPVCLSLGQRAAVPGSSRAGVTFMPCEL